MSTTTTEGRPAKLNLYIVLDAIDSIFLGNGRLDFDDLLKPFGLEGDSEEIGYRSSLLFQELWPNDDVMGAPDNALGREATLAEARAGLLEAAILERIVEHGSAAARTRRDHAASLLAGLQDAEADDA